MLFIHKNKGYLVPAIILFSLIFTQLISEKVTGDENFYQNYSLPKAIGFFLAAVILYALDQYFISKQKKMINHQTGEETILNEKTHSFFFLPLQIWAIICIFMAIASYLYDRGL